MTPTDDTASGWRGVSATRWRVGSRALVGFLALPAITFAFGAITHRGFPDFLLKPAFILILALSSVASGLVLRTMRSHVALLVAPVLTAVFVLVIGIVAG